MGWLLLTCFVGRSTGIGDGRIYSGWWKLGVDGDRLINWRRQERRYKKINLNNGAYEILKFTCFTEKSVCGIPYRKCGDGKNFGVNFDCLFVDFILHKFSDMCHCRRRSRSREWLLPTCVSTCTYSREVREAANSSCVWSINITD